MRTRIVAVLPRELVAGGRPARIGARTGLLAEGEGFSGLLVGAGGGAPDHRAAALVQGVSGEGGGILCGGLPNPGSTPHTGDFTDAYGNGMRVLAVANPSSPRPPSGPPAAAATPSWATATASARATAWSGWPSGAAGS